MKKLYFLLIIAFFMHSNGLAQALIAVHNETSTAFYASLDTAITKAQSGDYLYLPGGNFTITKPITKKLQIVGVGHNPDSCYTTGITQVTGDFVIKSGSDHGMITGLKIWGNITFTVAVSDPFVNYYIIERCNFSAVNLAARTLNILVNECVVHGNIISSSSQGFVMTKCVLEGGISGFAPNNYINNNIFLSAITYPTSGCDFKNNIFLASGPTPNSSYSAFYQNNSFTNAVSSIQNCNNNILAPIAGLFKNKTKSTFDYDQDYHVLATSPAHNAGLDGTDLGIYGTGNPWKDGSLPGNPHIQKNIISTINGVPNANTRVAAQDY